MSQLQMHGTFMIIRFEVSTGSSRLTLFFKYLRSIPSSLSQQVAVRCCVYPSSGLKPFQLSKLLFCYQQNLCSSCNIISR
jgi:hypothetical protein